MLRRPSSGSRTRPLALASGLLLSALLLAAAVLGSACRGGVRSPDLSRESLLLVTIDTLRPDRLGSYGYALAETPHLDALAEGGVRFAEVYSSVPLTLPSHATMFTGKEPFALGVRVNGVHFLPPSHRTLAALLGEQGFATFAAVAAYVVTSKFGLAQGFDVYDDSLGTADLFQDFDSEIPADRVIAKVERWLERRRGEDHRPFFAWVHLYDPHLPYAPPGELATRFRDRPYDGEIAFVDAQVGRLLEAFRARGLLESTLVVVTSDHGEAFGEHVEQGHGLLCYEEVLRVPLLFAAPGRIPAGHVVTERVRLVDLLPTLLELLGVEPPPNLDGRSFASLLAGGRESRPRDVYFESMNGAEFKNWAPLQGILVDRLKYIALPRPELYDLGADPHERRNLASLRTAEAERLRRELRRLLPSAPEPADSRRELTGEDESRLRALGYLSLSASSAGEPLDPKRGIVLEMELHAVRTSLEGGEVELAWETLERLTAENPDLEMPEIVELRHELAAAQGDPEAALAVLRGGIATFPEVEPLRFKLASYLVELERWDEAEAVGFALLEANPRMSQALNLLGAIAERREDLPAAIGFYERGLELEPGSIPLRARLADTLARQDEGQRALAIYELLIEDGALDADAERLYKAAMLNTRYGDPARAEGLFRRGLALAPGGVHHLSMAFILNRNGKLGEGIEHLELVLERYRADLSPQQAQLAARTLEQWRRSL